MHGNLNRNPGIQFYGPSSSLRSNPADVSIVAIFLVIARFLLLVVVQATDVAHFEIFFLFWFD